MIFRRLGTPFLEEFRGPGGSLWHQFGGNFLQGCAQEGAGVPQGGFFMISVPFWVTLFGNFLICDVI